MFTQQGKALSSMLSISTLAVLMMTIMGLEGFFPLKAEAVPAFARQTGKSCTSCHTVWPMLSKEGRKFKEAGYVSGDEEAAGEKGGGVIDVANGLTLSKINLGLRVVAVPYDKTSYKNDPGNDSDLATMRALNELGLFAAGIAGKNLSSFIEMSAAADGGFAMAVENGVIGYHPLESANIYLGYSVPTFADPYSALSKMRRVNLLGKRKVRDFMTGPSQFVSLSGRAGSLPQVFYLAAVSANNKDGLEHTPLGNSTLRVAYDALPWLSIGGLYQGEKAKYDYGAGGTYTKTADASNVGLDATIQFEDGLDANLCYVIRDNKEGKDKNNILAVEAGYPLKLGEKQIIPYARVERYTTNDGKDKFTDYHLSLNHLIRPNLKGQINYDVTDKGANGNDESRITLVADIGF